MAGRKAWQPNAEDIKEIEGLSGRGLYDQDIAQHIGISLATWSKYKAIPKTGIAEALKRGRTKARVALTNTLFEEALGRPDKLTGKPTQKVNSAALIFSLKARHGWRENEPAPAEDVKPEFYDDGKTITEE